MIREKSPRLIFIVAKSLIYQLIHFFFLFIILAKFGLPARSIKCLGVLIGLVSRGNWIMSDTLDDPKDQSLPLVSSVTPKKL